jgi:hypothetical protein
MRSAGGGVPLRAGGGRSRAAEVEGHQRGEDGRCGLPEGLQGVGIILRLLGTEQEAALAANLGPQRRLHTSPRTTDSEELLAEVAPIHDRARAPRRARPARPRRAGPLHEREQALEGARRRLQSCGAPAVRCLPGLPAPRPTTVDPADERGRTTREQRREPVCERSQTPAAADMEPSMPRVAMGALANVRRSEGVADDPGPSLETGRPSSAC